MRFNYLKIFFHGLLSGLALPYFYFLPLYITGTYFLLKELDNTKSHINCFLLGCIFGFGQFLVGMHWIIFPLFFDEKYNFLIPLILIFFPAFLSIFYGMVGLGISFYSKKVNLFKNGFFLTHIFFLSLIIFFFEFLRSYLFGGFPWNLSSHIWAFNHLFISTAKLFGAHGLSFTTIYWIVFICIFFYLRKYKISLSSLVLFPVIILVYGLLSQSHVSENTIKVRVVQPSISQKLKWSPEHQKQNFEKLISLSTKLNDKVKEPEIIIWPESAIPYYLNEVPKIVSSLSKRLPQKSFLITGSLKKIISNEDLKIYNSLYLIKDELILESYDKIKLVPFGEFMPFRRFLPFDKITSGSTDFKSGSGRKVFKIKLSNNKEVIVEPSICYEGIFSMKDISDSRPDFLINITNDAWFGETTGPAQHLVSNKFRAVERGVPLIRAANNGISAIINNNGKIIKNLELNESAYLDINLNVGFSENLYSKYGNLTLLFLILVSSLLSFFIDKLLLVKKK